MKLSSTTDLKPFDALVAREQIGREFPSLHEHEVRNSIYDAILASAFRDALENVNFVTNENETSCVRDLTQKAYFQKMFFEQSRKLPQAYRVHDAINFEGVVKDALELNFRARENLLIHVKKLVRKKLGTLSYSDKDSSRNKVVSLLGHCRDLLPPRQQEDLDFANADLKRDCNKMLEDGHDVRHVQRTLLRRSVGVLCSLLWNALTTWISGIVIRRR